jgi:hypothetical protein
MIHRLRPLGVLLAGCAIALGAPAAALARPTITNLRVEAGGSALQSTTGYVHDTARIRTSRRPGCEGSRQRRTISGPTALGILAYADNVNRRLRPVEISDQFEFGLFVCGIGGFQSAGAERFWSLKVNHVLPERGGDQIRVGRGDEVLWFFVDASTGTNTGNELVLQAPSRARPGESVGVRVLVYSFSGLATPAAGAQVMFDENAVTTDSNGNAQVPAGSEGSLRLRATRGSDVPSTPLTLCVNDDLSRCPALRGQRIVGTNRSQTIRGSQAGDSIAARGGNDVVRVRGGDLDRVSCGRGRDLVVASANDRISRNCERRRIG